MYHLFIKHMAYSTAPISHPLSSCATSHLRVPFLRQRREYFLAQFTVRTIRRFHFPSYVLLLTMPLTPRARRTAAAGFLCPFPCKCSSNCARLVNDNSHSSHFGLFFSRSASPGINALLLGRYRFSFSFPFLNANSFPFLLPYP